MTYLNFTAALQQDPIHKMCSENEHLLIYTTRTVITHLCFNSESFEVALAYSSFVDNYESLMAHVNTDLHFYLLLPFVNLSSSCLCIYCKKI